MSQFIKDTKVSEKKYQKVHNLQDKPCCKNIYFGYCNYKVNASKSFNIDNHKIQKSKLIKSQ